MLTDHWPRALREIEREQASENDNGVMDCDCEQHRLIRRRRWVPTDNRLAAFYRRWRDGDAMIDMFGHSYDDSDAPTGAAIFWVFVMLIVWMGVGVLWLLV